MLPDQEFSVQSEGAGDSHVYFELEKTGTSVGQEDGQGLNDEDKYRTARPGPTSDTNVAMPSKTSFSVLAKAKILEATGFFQTGTGGQFSSMLSHALWM